MIESHRSRRSDARLVPFAGQATRMNRSYLRLRPFQELVQFFQGFLAGLVPRRFKELPILIVKGSRPTTDAVLPRARPANG